MPARDVFAIEALSLKMLYTPFRSAPGARRAHLAGCSTLPTAARGARRAPRAGWQLRGGIPPTRFLIEGRDGAFPPACHTVFATEGVGVGRTPYRAPVANARADRRIRSVREKRPGHLTIADEAHPRRVQSA